MDVNEGQSDRRFQQAKTEAANRAEITALLIRFGYGDLQARGGLRR
jgi:hypothetical protein